MPSTPPIWVARTSHSLGDCRNSIPVLITVHINTFFVEMYRVARLLQHSRRFRPLVFFGWPYPTIARDVDCCLADAIPCSMGPLTSDVQRSN